MKRKKSLSVAKRNAAILTHLKDLKTDYPFWGYRRYRVYLYYRQGIKDNKKRIYRLMRENNLLVIKLNKYRAKRKVFRPSHRQLIPTRSGVRIWPRSRSAPGAGINWWLYLIVTPRRLSAIHSLCNQKAKIGKKHYIRQSIIAFLKVSKIALKERFTWSLIMGVSRHRFLNEGLFQSGH